MNSWILSHATPLGPDDDLSLGPGDLVEISVFLVSELSQLKVRIPSNGNIMLPLIGAVPAGGRSSSELAEGIKARLQQKYMHDPQVSVFILEHRSQQIAVFGSVKNAGVYPLVGRLRVTDALAMAGALTDDADHVIYLIRPSSTRPAHPQPNSNSQRDTPEAVAGEVMIPIDLEALTTERREVNLALRAGDAVHVPRAGSYYVGGEVARPGSFLLRAKTNLHQAIVAAGGVKPDAQWGDIRVYRPKPDGQTELLRFSLTEFEEGQDSPEIVKNDVVIVGKSDIKAFWYGFLNFIRFGVGASVP